MWQLLILVVVIALVYLMARSKRKPTKKIDVPEIVIVKCQSCDLNLPISEAFKNDDGWFCSENRECQNL